MLRVSFWQLNLYKQSLSTPKRYSIFFLNKENEIENITANAKKSITNYLVVVDIIVICHR